MRLLFTAALLTTALNAVASPSAESYTSVPLTHDYSEQKGIVVTDLTSDEYTPRYILIEQQKEALRLQDKERELQLRLEESASTSKPLLESTETPASFPQIPPVAASIESDIDAPIELLEPTVRFGTLELIESNESLSLAVPEPLDSVQ